VCSEGGEWEGELGGRRVREGGRCGRGEVGLARGGGWGGRVGGARRGGEGERRREGIVDGAG